MTAPTDVVDVIGDDPAVEVVEETDSGEMRVRFPVLVIENFDTSDGRFIEPGALTHRPLPLSLLAQTESAHGGDDPGPAAVVGRLDTLTRVPGSEVMSPRTSEPFPADTFVWQATGAIDASSPVAEMVRRGYLRGVSVDLVGMDYDILGEDEMADSDNPRRQLITRTAEIGAATLVALPAFGDAYVELEDEHEPPEPLAPEDLPDELFASAVPAWRSADVGDAWGARTAPLLAAGDLAEVEVPGDAVEQLRMLIDDGTDRDAEQLARAIVDHIVDTWSERDGGEDEDEVSEDQPPAVSAAADEDDVAGFEYIPVAERRRLAREGIAMPDGKYPVRNRRELESAIRLAGRADDPEAARRHIMRRAEVLDLTSLIPDTWNQDGTLKRDGSNSADVEALADITAEERRRAAEDGDAMPDGSFPIRNGEDLENAIHAVGRSKDDHDAVRRHIMRRARDLGMEDRIPDTWNRDGSLKRDGSNAAEEHATLTAAANTTEDVYLADIPSDEHRKRPPLSWFTDPGLTEETPITVDGQRVFGHVALWNRPHLSFGGQNVYAPRSRRDYREFMRGAVKAVDPDGVTRIVSIGHITAGSGHAEEHMRSVETARFYDHAGYSVARVAVGEDDHGIWCAGIINPGATDEQIDDLLAHPPSGDWRRVGGSLELVGVLCVNVPGFGTNRARIASGVPLTLVASSGLPPVRVRPTGVDVAALAAAVVDEQEQRAAARAVPRLIDALDDTAARHAALVAELDDTPAVVAALLAELDDDGEDYQSQMPPQLRESYLRGEVAARIQWGTPGDFTRCVAQARQHDVPARMRNGMCAELHHAATGLWPGDSRNP